MRWKYFCVVAATLAAMGSAQARDLTHAELLGTWCGDISKYVFTRQSLTVTWYGKSDQRVLDVASWEFSDTWINVKWKPPYGNTVFGEFRDDGKLMAQMPNDSGDMGPRRVFRRCN